MAVRTWKAQSLPIAIVEVIEKKGSISDIELLETLRSTSTYKDLSFNELNRILMRMEISGIILVSSLTKGRRLIQLVNKK